ncbi:MAG: protein kinase [Longimicrobiales bacterium]
MPDPITRLNAALSGRYRIERQLGEGGMATVYLANDLRHSRKVALKVLKPELAAVIGGERFLAEIKTTANLQHPHILPLFDSGEADTFLFYVMPYVEGETLREKIDRERQLAVGEAVSIATKVARALQAAHERGVIHRDIKPANILLSNGESLVSDFGIALAVTSGGAGRLTETGLSLGTPHYMSPEQATGDMNVGAATDIYALGCVLYEMLVGEPPYTGSTPQAVLGKIVTGEPDPVTKHRRTVPANVDGAIRKALEKVPADRFGSASELAKALGDVGFRHGGEALAGTASGRGLWNPLSVGLGGLAAVTTLALLWSISALLRPEPPKPVERFALDTYQQVMGLPSLLPDGSGMVYGVGQLMLRRWGTLDPVPVSGGEAVSAGGTPVVSPSGGEVAFITTANELKVVPLGGGIVRTLAADASCCTRWGTDGFVYYSPVGVRNIRRVPETGGAVEEVTAREDGSGNQGDFQILADGDVGVFTGNWFRSDLRIDAIRLSTGERKPLTSGVKPYVTPTGHLVFASLEGQILAAPFDADAMELTGPAVTVIEGVYATPSGSPVFSVSPDGSLIYVEGTGFASDARLAVVDLEGNQQILPLAPRVFAFGPSWSPDGESVVFSSEGQIYTYDVVRNTAPRQITLEGNNLAPVYSPDGTRVAFSSVRDRTEGADLFVKDLTDDSPPTSILTLEADQLVMQWPADTLIVFEQGASGNADLWTLDLSDPASPEARPYLTSEANLQRIVVSPDGRLAAYRSNESGTSEIYIRSFPNAGERTVVSRGGGSIPYWSPDGRTLYYHTGNGRAFVAARLLREPVPAVLSLDTLFSAPGYPFEPFPGAALHPDGDRFISTVLDAAAGAEGEATAPQRIILVKNFFEELKRLVPN